MGTDLQIEQELADSFRTRTASDLMDLVAAMQIEWSRFSVDVLGIALRLAVREGRSDLVQPLIRFGARLNVHTQLLSDTAGLAIMPVTKAGVSRLGILRLLLQSGMSADMELDGLPLLHHAIHNRAYAQVAILLSERADPFMRSSDDESNAYEVANRIGDAVAMDLLRETWRLSEAEKEH